MIPFEDFGGEGYPLHFAHANGYPPGAYRVLLMSLAKSFHVLSMHMRPLWPQSKPDELQDWKIFSEDLLRFLEQQRLEKIVGVGHSMGATATLRLALWEPELFAALVLIDPVIFPPWKIWQWSFISHLGLAERFHPLIKSAKKRRRIFENQMGMFENYRQKGVFQLIDDQVLQDYVDAMSTHRNDGRVELKYTPEWESRVYLTGIRADLDIWRSLQSLNVPLFLIRGQATNTFWEETARRMQNVLPDLLLEVVENTTHLVPLEKPLLVSGVIQDNLNRLGFKNSTSNASKEKSL